MEDEEQSPLQLPGAGLARQIALDEVREDGRDLGALRPGRPDHILGQAPSLGQMIQDGFGCIRASG